MNRRICKRCGKVAEGTSEELKKVFITARICRECHSEYVNDKKKAENMSLDCEDLIDVLDEQGYPLNKKGLDEFIKSSYDSALDLKRARLRGEINRFYEHYNIKQILKGEFKPCSTCKKFHPLTSFRDIKRGNNIYKDSYCPMCLRERNKEYRRKYANDEQTIEAKRRWREENKDRIKEINSRYRKSHLNYHSTRMRLYRLETLLKEKGFEVDKKKIELLLEIKDRENIKKYDDLIEMHGGTVCLKKI